MREPAGAHLTDVFGALADPVRMALLEKLTRGVAIESGREPEAGQSIAQLTDGFALSHQGITKHLRVLERAGLVRAHKRGREKRYAVARGSLDETRTYLDQVSRDWDIAITRLKTYVER